MCPFVYYFNIVYFSKNHFLCSSRYRVNIEPLSRDNREQLPSVVVNICSIVFVFDCRLLGGNAYRNYAKRNDMFRQT